MAKRSQSFFIHFANCIFVLSVIFPSSSQASDEYVNTKVGSTIYIEGCIPFNAQSPIYLVSYTTKKQLMKISFNKSTLTGISQPSYCRGDWNIYKKWKVSIKGTHELAVYIPNLKKYYEISPFGIRSGLITKSPEEIVLDKPAADFFVPGTALVTLQQVWGIRLNNDNGPKSLRLVTDEMYKYLCRSIGDKVSQSDLEISFQPGNSMNSFFSRLILNTEVYQVVKNRLIYNANQP
jgi:hypothetical protein